MKGELPNSFPRGDPDHGVVVCVPATHVCTHVLRLRANQSVVSFQCTSSRVLRDDGGFDEHAGLLGLQRPWRPPIGGCVLSGEGRERLHSLVRCLLDNCPIQAGLAVVPASSLPLPHTPTVQIHTTSCKVERGYWTDRIRGKCIF